MPILKKEIDYFPDRLFEEFLEGKYPDSRWWAIYTLPRHEKKLMRHLVAHQVPFYGPTVMRRHRSPNGRMRVTHEPLFPNYVFMLADEHQRTLALTTNCISRCVDVPDGFELARDLQQIRRLIDTGHPLTPESRLTEGQFVRVKSGTFAGFEGIVLRREKETRLLVAVKFMQSGATVVLDDCTVEPI